MPKRAKRKQKPRVADVSPHIFTCEDKDFTRDPHENHPFSARPDAIIGLFSRPGGGKSSIVKNFLCHGGYRKVFVAHGAGDHSKEYELVDYEPVSFDTHGPDYYVEQSKECGGAPMVLVCDDLAYADFGKIARANMYKIAQFVCTHYRMTPRTAGRSWCRAYGGCVPCTACGSRARIRYRTWRAGWRAVASRSRGRLPSARGNMTLC